MLMLGKKSVSFWQAVWRMRKWGNIRNEGTCASSFSAKAGLLQSVLCCDICSEGGLIYFSFFPFCFLVLFCLFVCLAWFCFVLLFVYVW